MKNNYKNTEYYGFLVQGDLHGAIKYLSSFKDKEKEVQKYQRRFAQRQYKHKTSNKTINKITDAYNDYFVDYFWENMNEAEAREILQGKLLNLLEVDSVIDFSECEKLLKVLVEKEDFNFLGGMTGMLYGPYIWKKTDKIYYNVKIPTGEEEVLINMLEGFVTRSWLDFISFSKIGTGGWASQDNELYCIKSAYKKKIDTSLFQISYLKHEAQHLHDFREYSNMTGVDLEYRAKLTELIYYPNIKLLHSFINQASKSNKDNPHAYAAYMIVRDLSCEIFGENYVDDWVKWNKKGKLVKKYAYDLLMNYKNREGDHDEN